MITLTSPAQINSVLGGNVPVAYNRLVLSSITFDTALGSVSARVSLTSSASPTMQEIRGTLQISEGRLEIAVQQLDFYRRVNLTAPQQAAVQTIIDNAQNALEGGLISLGVIAGVQSQGA